MTVSARPQTKFAAALAAAGVVSAASVAAMPEQVEPPTVSIEVTNAAVTDTLYGLGTGVAVLDSLVGLHVDATISLPFEASLAVLAAAEHPEVAPNVLSYLVQRFVNPAVGPPIAAYPWETEQTVAVFATLLPYPLGPSVTDPGLVNEGRFAFADAFDSVLGQLPDPLPGYAAVKDVETNTALGRTIVAGQAIARTPLYTAWTAADYLGDLPANLAADPPTPGELPTLAGNVIRGLLTPVDHSPEANALSPNATSSVGVQRSSAVRTLTKPVEKRHEAGKDADTPAGDASAVTVRAGGPKHRAPGQSLTDRLTRALTRHDQAKPVASSADAG